MRSKKNRCPVVHSFNVVPFALTTASQIRQLLILRHVPCGRRISTLAIIFWRSKIVILFYDKQSNGAQWVINPKMQGRDTFFLIQTNDSKASSALHPIYGTHIASQPSRLSRLINKMPFLQDVRFQSQLTKTPLQNNHSGILMVAYFLLPCIPVLS